MPGFEEAEVTVGGAARIEESAATDTRHFGNRDDVPEIEGDYEAGEEINVLGAIGAVLAFFIAGTDAAHVSARRATRGVADAEHGGLDLDAPKEPATLDDEVVAGRVTPRLGDGESFAGGAGHKLQFDPFAATLVVRNFVSFCHGDELVSG